MYKNDIFWGSLEGRGKKSKQNEPGKNAQDLLVLIDWGTVGGL